MLRTELEALKRKKRVYFLRNLTTWLRIMCSGTRIKADREVQLSRTDREKGGYLSELTRRRLLYLRMF
jgi:hypothetical protein